MLFAGMSAKRSVCIVKASAQATSPAASGMRYAEGGLLNDRHELGAAWSHRATAARLMTSCTVGAWTWAGGISVLTSAEPSSCLWSVAGTVSFFNGHSKG